MLKRIGLMISILFVFVLCVQTAQAQMINYKRKNRAQGKASNISQNTYDTSTTMTSPSSTTEESTSSTKSPSWMITPPTVQYESEKEFDFNSDGYLQRAEVVAFLRNVVRQVQTKGAMKINSDILLAYDTNNDGSIDRNEIKNILRDIGK